MTNNLAGQPAIQFLIPHLHEKRPLSWTEASAQEKIVVEIGSGLGEFLIKKAAESPGVRFLGIEQEWKRVEKILKGLKRNNLQNVRVLQTDARLIFERYLSPKSVSDIFCLFPCPWPKRAHIKHRLFNQEFLRLINSRLCDRGQLQIVTDHFPYIEWILEELPDTGFLVEKSVIPAQFDTKFEKKWREGGQHQFFELKLVKDTHQTIPLKEDIRLKELSVKSFDPKKFKLCHTQGEIPVIFKEFFFDPKKKTAAVFIFVVEKYLTQPVWISLIEKKGLWRIWPLKGCSYIPTPGIQKAMEAVRDEAERSGKKARRVSAK